MTCRSCNHKVGKVIGCGKPECKITVIPHYHCLSGCSSETSRANHECQPEGVAA